MVGSLTPPPPNLEDLESKPFLSNYHLFLLKMSLQIRLAGPAEPEGSAGQILDAKSVLSNDLLSIAPPPLNCQTFHRLWFELKNNISSAILAILSTHYYGAGLLII